jgi:hypothetical protein
MFMIAAYNHITCRLAVTDPEEEIDAIGTPDNTAYDSHILVEGSW